MSAIERLTEALEKHDRREDTVFKYDDIREILDGLAASEEERALLVAGVLNLEVEDIKQVMLYVSVQRTMTTEPIEPLFITNNKRWLRARRIEAKARDFRECFDMEGDHLMGIIEPDCNEWMDAGFALRDALDEEVPG